MNISDNFGEPDARGVVQDDQGRQGIRGRDGFVFFFRDDPSERYARCLAGSTHHRKPLFIKPEIEDGKLVLALGNRRVIVLTENWDGLKDALVRIHFNTKANP
jgi:hypothetical protein